MFETMKAKRETRRNVKRAERAVAYFIAGAAAIATGVRELVTFYKFKNETKEEKKNGKE